MITCLIVTAAALILLIIAVFFITCALSDADVKLIYKTKFGKQLDSLRGKVVWITGASSGIGESIAYCLAKAGCKLVLSARRKDELDRVKTACLDFGKGKITSEDILVLPLDIVNYGSHESAVQQVIEYFKKIDILVNNAGRSQRAAWMDVQLSVDRELFETNVLGQVSLTRAVLPHMISRKEGHIALMSSLAGIMGVPDSRSYTGSKHALHGYFNALRTEMSEHKIHVTTICPGPTFSNLFIHAATATTGEKLGREMESKEKRMSTDRCAYLSCVAIANQVYETWLVQQPILFLVYINQYIPDLAKWITTQFGAEKIKKMREGK